MFAQSPALFSALALAAAVPAAAGAEQPVADAPPVTRPDTSDLAARKTAADSYGDRNRGGPYGFYSYPRHRSVAGGGGSGLVSRPLSGLSGGTAPPGNTHGSAWYGRDYGAPYFGGGYYDGGTYYRERRDR